MYISTDMIESIEASIFELFDCTSSEVEEFSRSLYDGCVEKGIIDGVSIKQKVFEFTAKRARQQIDSVCMHHLSRRLVGSIDEEKACSNLAELLLSNSPIANFLKAHGISFVKDEKIIHMFHNGIEIVPEFQSPASSRIKIRLGQSDYTQIDQCINGFAFADRIDKAGYFLHLHRCPELISDLAELLDFPLLVEDYKQSSDYFLYTYLLPIDMVIMNNKEDATRLEKVNMLLSECFYRLYDYYCEPDRSTWFDHGNIYMRISDDVSLTGEHFQKRTRLDFQASERERDDSGI